MNVQTIADSLDTIERDIILRGVCISHSYDAKTSVLENVSVELREGLLTMLLGRSGSGKTTLLKILANVVKPAEGHVQTFFKQSFSAKRIAYIPQNLGLVRNMTVWDNVMTGALGYTNTLRSLMKKFDRDVCARAKDILLQLGIADKVEKKVWHLSGGERQRVAIARALIQDPQIILADEFVSQLDPVTSTEILDIMSRLLRSKITVLMTTHDVGLAQQYADRVLVMKKGQICREYSAVNFSSDEIFAVIS